MPKVRDVLNALEQLAPKRFALSFDKVGLQVGDFEVQVNRGVVSLDRSLATVDFAIETKSQILVSHHPLIFQPIASVDSRTHVGRTILRLASHGIAFAAAHTNWDAAKGGINDALADLFQLQDVRSFGMAAEIKKLKLVFFAPAVSTPQIIDAVSEAGAGMIGKYRRCAFTNIGTGSFWAPEGSDPHVGKAGESNLVDETRVEMVLREDQMSTVARALRLAHPYEEPALDFFHVSSENEAPNGRVGKLPEPMTLADFVAKVDSVLDTHSLAWGDPSKKIKKVAVVGGAADSEWVSAQKAGADVLVTGEVKQNVAVEASESGICILASGHYATEQPGCAALQRELTNLLPEIQWQLFVPMPGSGGRPLK